MSTYDLFSDQSKLYASFRPTYPDELYAFVMSHVQGNDAAWDCATGNGQVARVLARNFKSIQATDISAKQLQYAHREPNINYTLQPAEHTSFPSGTFDLITVAQGLHWFKLDEFYAEVKRTGKQGGLVAVWGYANVITRSDIHEIVLNFYHNVVGEFWEPARKHVEDHYRTLSFPFREIETPEFTIRQDWNLKHLLGYIESWSATQTYIKKKNNNPMEKLAAQLEKVCEPEETIQVRFPVFLRLGSIEK